MNGSSPYERLVDRFVTTGTPFREIDHPPADTAAAYHEVVGSRLAQQAKALLLRRYRADGRDYLIHALPGDRSADLGSLAAAVGAVRLRLATARELHEATGCRFGELPPVGSVFGVALSLDDRLLAEPELYFNAGRLDRSFVVEPEHLRALERPVIVRDGRRGDG